MAEYSDWNGAEWITVQRDPNRCKGFVPLRCLGAKRGMYSQCRHGPTYENGFCGQHLNDPRQRLHFPTPAEHR